MFICAIVGFVFAFVQKTSFGMIGETVTLRIREQLYRTILSKHLGWFDEKEHAPGILTDVMASDAQVINGVSAEGLASSLSAFLSIVAGISLSFVFNWRMALCCLATTPFMVLGGIMNVKFQKGLSEGSESAHKDANLLAGDVILNYRTVASFGHEDQIIKDYNRYL